MSPSIVPYVTSLTCLMFLAFESTEILAKRCANSGKDIVITDFLVREPSHDFLFEDLKLIFHLGVDVPLSVRDHSPRNCVANLVTLRVVPYITVYRLVP